MYYIILIDALDIFINTLMKRRYSIINIVWCWERNIIDQYLSSKLISLKYIFIPVYYYPNRCTVIYSKLYKFWRGPYNTPWPLLIITCTLHRPDLTPPPDGNRLYWQSDGGEGWHVVCNQLDLLRRRTTIIHCLASHMPWNLTLTINRNRPTVAHLSFMLPGACYIYPPPPLNEKLVQLLYARIIY